MDGMFVACKSILLMLSRDVRRTFVMTCMSRGSVRKSGLTRGCGVGCGHCHSLILTGQASLYSFLPEL